MTGTAAVLVQITSICWIVGLLAIPGCLISWAFSGGLFAPPADRLIPGTLSYVLFALCTSVLFLSILVGSTACLSALLETGQQMCRMLHEGRRSKLGYYMIPVIFWGMLFFIIGNLISQRIKKEHET